MTDGTPRSETAKAPAGDAFAAVTAALDRAHALAREWAGGLAGRPVSRRLGPEEMATLLDEPLPQQGSDPADVAAEWLDRAGPGIVASPGPRFFGFVNGGSTPAALAGDWLASAIDQNAGFWLSSPAAAQTELVVLGWLKALFGLPAGWSGAMTSGATMANLVGLAAARQWAGGRLGFDPAADGLAGHPPIPVVSSTEIHASALKALGTLGIGRAAVRLVPAPGGAVDLDALGAALGEIDGPVVVVANDGEVNTGAFDALDRVADLCQARPAGAWLHVDGAFGLFAAVSSRYRALVAGIDRADSVAADGHKWLNVPYDSGFAFVRDAEALRAAFSATGAYIAPAAGAGWDPASHVPEMSGASGARRVVRAQGLRPRGVPRPRRALLRERHCVRRLGRSNRWRRADGSVAAEHRLLPRRRTGAHGRPAGRAQSRDGRGHPARRPRVRHRDDLARPGRDPRRVRQLGDDARRRRDPATGGRRRPRYGARGGSMT